ncbi:MAG: MarR family transcriptional regulator, partial [Pseudomonadales bacterium]|nr:MarR family transcriptional regulator [Pseudomonadales bacterium]
MQVLDTATALERSLDSALSFSRGVTFSEYRLLRTLKTAENGLTRVVLAQMVSVTPSGVTRALKPLEKLGYVT